MDFPIGEAHARVKSPDFEVDDLGSYMSHFGMLIPMQHFIVSKKEDTEIVLATNQVHTDKCAKSLEFKVDHKIVNVSLADHSLYHFFNLQKKNF